MGTENQLVKVEHLYKEFDAETKVLSDINLTINKNEVIAILGPSELVSQHYSDAELPDCSDKGKDYHW